MSKRVVVVGGSSGIGLQLVRMFVEAGDSVTVLSRSWDHATELPSVAHSKCDVAVDDFTEIALPDRIDCLAYCPGSINLRSIRAMSIESLRADFELNVVGAVKIVQASIKSLKSASAENPSSIVLFSSVAASKGLQMHASVSACKGALEALTRTLAADLSPQIRVNCVAPALTDTPLAANFFAGKEKSAAMAKLYPLGRTGKASDIASLAYFLLSDQASWITGQVIGVDGGMSTVKK